jgi:hypothetical protein
MTPYPLWIFIMVVCADQYNNILKQSNIINSSICGIESFNE